MPRQTQPDSLAGGPLCLLGYRRKDARREVQPLEHVGDVRLPEVRILEHGQKSRLTCFVDQSL